MEHIVQFAVGVDDEGIKKYIEEHSIEVIEKQLKQDVINKIFRADYYNGNANPARSPLSDYAKDIIVDVMNEHKDAIINRTAEILADKLCRTKAAKELLGVNKE